MNTRITFFCTYQEREQIMLNAKARGLSQTEYCRLAALLLMNNDDFPITKAQEFPDAY